MGNNYKRILSLFAWLSLILFVVRMLITIQDVVDMINNSKILELIYSFVGYAGEAIFVSGLLLLFYNKFLWKYLNFWRVPVLAKHYSGTFISSYDNKEREAELIVQQTFLSIKVKMKTAESWSCSICESLENHDGVNLLTYTYLNKPDSKLYDRSKMHYGTVTFDCDDPHHLKGDYYTDRKTTGSMVFEAK